MNKIDKIAKEFYGQYGLAMHFVQIIESGLLELYAIKRLVDSNLSDLEYYKILANPEKLTLGQLNNRLFKLNFLEKEVKSNLITANKYRIFLAHRFWWEREILFDNHIELEKIHKELFSYINHFQNLIKIIDQKINTIRLKNKLHIEKENELEDFILSS